MRFRGVDLRDMTPEQLEEVETYTANAIAQHTSHIEMLKAGYSEIAAEYERRDNLGADKSLN
ncbi:MAG TPA: hypothetical protein VIO94_15910 [Phenylobacterium sp.]